MRDLLKVRWRWESYNPLSPLKVQRVQLPRERKREISLREREREALLEFVIQ